MQWLDSLYTTVPSSIIGYNHALFVSQVFGKLLEWDNTSSESGNEGAAGVADEAATRDDTDLREHVVGILFAGHKLTSLQKQVINVLDITLLEVFRK